MIPAVAFDDVTFRIKGRPILDRVSFELGRGETLAILGRSGAGKSTVLKLINRMLLPSEGEVRVDGKSTSAWDPIRLRRQTGYVIQDVGLLPHLRVAENVGLVPKLEGWNPDRIGTRVSELLNQLGLPAEQFAGRRPSELSGGQKQRIGIARALAADPMLLLLDEPFGALDPITRVDLQNQFLDLTRKLGKTAVFVTHDVQEALRVGTRIAVMAHGKLELLTTPAEFLRQTSGETAKFLGCLGNNWPRMDTDARG